MAQAKLHSITSTPAPSRFVHAVSSAGAGRIVRVNGALRALAELCWDGEGTEGDAKPHVTRNDLADLIWLVQSQVDAHVDEVMSTIEETN